MEAALPIEPHPGSVEIMAVMDSLPRRMRELVHEFGLVIVAEMIDEGYYDPEALRDMLETWRERRQAQWLATDYVTKRTARSIVEAALMRQAFKDAA
jgi:hypothetical protein